MNHPIFLCVSDSISSLQHTHTIYKYTKHIIHMNGIFEHARVTISVPNFNFNGSWVIDAKKISYEISVNGNITLHIIQEPLVVCKKEEEKISTSTAKTTRTTKMIPRRNPPRLKEEPTDQNQNPPQPTTSPIEPKATASPMSPMGTTQVAIRLPPENVEEEGTPPGKNAEPISNKSESDVVVAKVVAKEDCSGQGNANEDVGGVTRGSPREVCAAVPSCKTMIKEQCSRVTKGDDDQRGITMGATKDNVVVPLDRKSARKGVHHSSSTSRKRARTKEKVSISRKRNGSTKPAASRAVSRKPADPKPALVAGSQAIPFDGYIRRSTHRGSAPTQHQKRRTRGSSRSALCAIRKCSQADWESSRVEEKEAVSHNPDRRSSRGKKEERGIPDEDEDDEDDDEAERKRKRKRNVYLCSIEGCRAQRQGKRVDEGDHFGPSGYRCFLHGGNKRRRKGE